jgi:hypothetical protein
MTVPHSSDDTFIGIEIGGARLDVAWHRGDGGRYARRSEAIAALVQRLPGSQSDAHRGRADRRPRETVVKWLGQARLHHQCVQGARHVQLLCIRMGVTDIMSIARTFAIRIDDSASGSPR